MFCVVLCVCVFVFAGTSGDASSATWKYGSAALSHLLELAETKHAANSLVPADTKDIGIYRWLWPLTQVARFQDILKHAEAKQSDLAKSLKLKEADGSSSGGAAASSSKLLEDALAVFYNK